MADDPWKEFRTGATTPAASASDPWADFRQPAPPSAASSVLGDVVKSAASGLANGLAETAMLPVTVGRLADDATGWIVDKVDRAGRAVLGMDPASPETVQARQAARAHGVNGYVYGAQDAARSAVSAVSHKPETTAGEFARTVGEFAVPGAALGTGGRVARAVGDVIVPALVSETAGQVLKGTGYEDVGRLAGGVAGGAATGAARAYRAPESVVRRAAGNVSPDEWRQAGDLANNRFGVPLTGPEAVAQVTGGGTRLPDLQRVVEGSLDGGAVMSEFYRNRPAQVRQAVADALDTIAPQDAAPSTLGARAQTAAQAVVDDTRRGINNATRPYYRAAETHLLPEDEFAALADDPRFAAGVARLRGNPELAPDYEHLPDNAVAVVDAVTKDLFARGEALANRANPLYGPELAARSTTAGAAARDLARDPARGGSEAYDTALQMQSAARRDVLQPVEAGPVGRVAATDDTRAAYDALLPRRPLAGSQDEITRTIVSLLEQDAPTTRALVRQGLGDTYDNADRRLQSGENQAVGARFAADVAGSPQQETNLRAVLTALPDDEAAAIFPDLLTTLRATGQRKAQGSPTAFNEAIMRDLGTDSLSARGVDTIRTLSGTRLLTAAGDAAKRALLARGVTELAQMFAAPNSVELLRQAAARGGLAPYVDAGGRAGAIGAAGAGGR